MSQDTRHPETTVFLVTRSIPLSFPSAAERDRVLAALAQTDGVLGARVDRNGRLRIHYDAARIGFGDVEHALTAAGLSLPTGASWRLKSAWYRYLDANARSNAQAKAGACCSKPTDIYANRRRP